MAESQSISTNKNWFLLKHFFFFVESTSPGYSLSHELSFQSGTSTLNSANYKKFFFTHIHIKGQFGGAAGGLGLWLGNSSGNVLGPSPNLCVFMCTSVSVAIHQRHYRSPGRLGRKQLATGISRLCL